MVLAKRGGNSKREKQQQTLNEFVVIFLIVFLLTNAVPDEKDRELLRPWFLLFCTVRLAFTFLLVLPEKLETEEQRS